MGTVRFRAALTTREYRRKVLPLEESVLFLPTNFHNNSSSEEEEK
jgi:hypothetical protein